MSGKRPGTPMPTEADLERKRLRGEPGQEVFRRPVTPDDVQGNFTLCVCYCYYLHLKLFSSFFFS